jgi:hypothetical protein
MQRLAKNENGDKSIVGVGVEWSATVTHTAALSEDFLSTCSAY